MTGGECEPQLSNNIRLRTYEAAATIRKDSSDGNGPGVKAYLADDAKNLHGADMTGSNPLFGTRRGQILEQALKL